MKTARMVFCTAVVVWLAAVFAWAELEMKLTPRSLNVNSKGQYFKCHLWDPEGDIDVSQIAVPVTMLLDGVGFPESGEVARELDGDVLTVFFARAAVEAALADYGDRDPAPFSVTAVVGGSGGPEPVVYYDTKDDIRFGDDGIPIGSSTFSLPVNDQTGGSYDWVDYINIDGVDGEEITVLFLTVGGGRVVFYTGTGWLGSYSVAGISLAGAQVIVSGSTASGAIYFSLTDIGGSYGGGGGEAVTLDDEIRVLRKDRGKK